MATNEAKGTLSEGYTAYLKNGRWAKTVSLLNPYRWNIRRLVSGKVLDVGCGTGRNLFFLKNLAVGIDHNPHSVKLCRLSGYESFVPDEFRKSRYAKQADFDTLLFSHVLEHMSLDAAAKLIDEYRRYLKPEASIIILTPQEYGFTCDPTHVEFMDFRKAGQLLDNLGFRTTRQFSFPFPTWVGKFFRHNEFVTVGKKL